MCLTGKNLALTAMNQKIAQLTKYNGENNDVNSVIPEK